jgi:hypothetical protein
MTEKDPQRKGAIWDPIVDCTPGRPENQPIVTIITEAEINVLPEGPVVTSVEPVSGVPKPKTQVRKGGKIIASQG